MEMNLKKTSNLLIVVIIVAVILGCRWGDSLVKKSSPEENSSNSTSNTTSPTKSTEELLPETVGDFKQNERRKKMDDYTVTDYGAIETYVVWYDEGVQAFVSKFKDSADADKTLNIFKGKATSTTGDYVSWAVMKNEEVKDPTGQVIGKMVLLIDFGDTAAKEKKEKGTPEPEYLLATHNNYLYRIYASKRVGDAQAFYNKLPFK
ncbi:hypothetical protein BH10ACI1_BH10ACI1_31820 [soil metagenome]